MTLITPHRAPPHHTQKTKYPRRLSRTPAESIASARIAFTGLSLEMIIAYSANFIRGQEIVVVSAMAATLRRLLFECVRVLGGSFFPVPSGVARAISRCPEEVKMSSILSCFVRFPMSGAHGCSSAPTRVALRDAWTTHERSWSPMSATPWHFRAALSATHCRFRAPTGVTHGRARAPMSVSHGHYQRQWVACIGARKFQ